MEPAACCFLDSGAVRHPRYVEATVILPVQSQALEPGHELFEDGRDNERIGKVDRSAMSISVSLCTSKYLYVHPAICTINPCVAHIKDIIFNSGGSRRGQGSGTIHCMCGFVWVIHRSYK